MTVGIYKRATGVNVANIRNVVTVRENEHAITIEAGGQKQDYVKSDYIFVVVAS